MEISKNRIRRSEEMTQQEWEAFKKYVDSFSTKVDCMEALNTTMPTLDRIYLKGSGRPDTIAKIREALNK